MFHWKHELEVPLILFSVCMYRLCTEVKVSMGFIIPSDKVTRLINAVLSFMMNLYHERISFVQTRCQVMY